MKNIRRKKHGGRNKIPLAGKTFGRLKVLRDSGRRTRYGKAVLWLCRCSCGNKTLAWGTALTHGWKRSCGCLSIDKLRARATTHGMSNTGTYTSWMCMKARCLDPNHVSFRNYGGRPVPITIDPRWLSKQGFSNFLADLGVRPEGCWLDRIDPDGNYQSANCRWAKPSEGIKRNSVKSIEEELDELAAS